MLNLLLLDEVVQSIGERFPDSQARDEGNCLIVESYSIADVMYLLHDSSEYDFNYLSNLTAVDYFEYFELVYQLLSITKRHSITVKTRCSGRENLEVPSVTAIWQGADLQEREIFDLLGINFTGHPNMKRIVLWEGFEGHPLRKDYL